MNHWFNRRRPSWRGLLPVLGALLAWGVASLGAELDFDFSTNKLDEPPAGFRSLLAGEGKPGDWRVILDEVAPSMLPLTPNAPSVAKKAVVAQVLRDPTDERFPLLVYDKETFGDFTLTAKVKTAGGAVEQMAGLVFRLQDEKNFYVVRISSLGNTFRFYRVANGLRDPPIGADVETPKGAWHEVSVTCQGNRFRILLNGNELIPELTDSSFSAGKLGFWTKSDSVSYFADVKVRYIPREYPAKALVRDMLQRYPRLEGLKVFATSKARPHLHIVASDDEKELHQPGGKVEQETISKNAVFHGKVNQKALVTMPLHDRNGEAIAAVRVVLRSFRGETQAHAVGRATPIIKAMEARVRGLDDLTE
jgi:hypothetical protein